MLLSLLLVPAAAPAQVTEDQKLLGHDGGLDAEFGAAVALVETETEALALVGAPGDAELAVNAGAVYAYRYDEGSGVWMEEAKFWPDEVGENSFVGHTVALSADGRLALISGAEPGPKSAPRYGRVHVFRRMDGAWVEEATLAASDETPLNGFGCSVAVSADGEVVAVGACQATGPRPGTGAVYIYRHDEEAEVWVEEAKVSTERGCFFTAFGAAVAISAAGDRVVTTEPCGEGGDPSALYFFHRSGPPDGPNGGWMREARFDARGGGAVALSEEGDLALAGLLFNSLVEVFEWQGETWVQTENITASGSSPSSLGRDAIVLEGDLALIGDVGADIQANSEGAAFLLHRGGNGDWVQKAMFIASAGEEFDRFGKAVALSERSALVGAPQEGEADALTGAAYLFALAPVVPAEPAPAVTAEALVAYPNPFVSALRLSYTLTSAVHVRLTVYDVLGREVAVLADEWQAAGAHRTRLAVAGLPVGLYVVRLEAGAHHLARRVVRLE